jgi:hypothetical protein
MPFDGTPTSSTQVRLLALGPDLLAFGPTSPGRGEAAARSLPAWHRCRRPDTLGDTLAVLHRARELLEHERRWCRGSFARGWRDIPVPVGSIVPRRYCALGAIMRAGSELSIPAEGASIALEWQVGRPVQDWNDDPRRTHAEVVALFDDAIYALRPVHA